VPAPAADKIGPTGAIIGINASEQMLHIAGERVAEHRWDNVELLPLPSRPPSSQAAMVAVSVSAWRPYGHPPRRLHPTCRPLSTTDLINT
jgi:hypothetical protein